MSIFCTVHSDGLDFWEPGRKGTYDWELDQNVLLEDGDARHEEHDGTGAGTAPQSEGWHPLEGRSRRAVRFGQIGLHTDEVG